MGSDEIEFCIGVCVTSKSVPSPPRLVLHLEITDERGKEVERLPQDLGLKTGQETPLENGN